jgi:pimeloyl-ACP methyl ester carboxylesterase
MFRQLLSLVFILIFLNAASSQNEDSPISFTGCFLKDCSEFDNDSTIRFGFLEVLENRDSTEGKKLKLAFVILESLSKESKAPLLFLSGGPGSESIKNINRWKSHFLRQERDIILTDFRGIGYSSNPICDGLTDDYFNVVAANFTPEEEQQAKMKVVFNCFDSLRSRGFEFGQYRSKVIVHDLESLRRSLGYKQWNLYGGSYGTRLGQTYLRDAPEGVRAFVSEATHPVGVNVLGNEVSSYRQSLNELFELCQNNPTCEGQFANLTVRFYSMVEKLKDQPIILEDKNFPTGKFYIDFQNTHQIFQQLLYFRSFYVAFPWLVKALENEDYEAFKNIVYFLRERIDHVSMANYLMVLRNEAFANVTLSKVQRIDPLNNALAFTEADYHIFHQMDFIPYDSIEKNPVTSDIPTLILAGSLDPISPPQHGKFVHQNFSNSYYMEFTGMGHGVMSSDCAKKITSAFLDQPTLEPDRQCLERLTESQIAFLPNIYENGKITTMLRQMALNLELRLLLPLGLAFILWIISMIQASINFFRQKKGQANAVRTRFIIRLTSTLICFLFLGLGWFVYVTVANHELLILVGLVNHARFLFWLSPLIIIGALCSIYLLIKNWNIMDQNSDKFLNTALTVVHLMVIFILFTFDLFPA